MTPLGGPSSLIPLKTSPMERSLAAMFVDKETLKISFETQLGAMAGVHVEPDPHLSLRPIRDDPGENMRKPELWNEYLGGIRPVPGGPLDLRKVRGDVLSLSVFLLDLAISHATQDALQARVPHYGPLEFLDDRHCDQGLSRWKPPANPINQLIVRIPMKDWIKESGRFDPMEQDPLALTDRPSAKMDMAKPAVEDREVIYRDNEEE